MKIPDNATVVLDIAGDWLRLISNKPEDEARLTELGFVVDDGYLVRRVLDALDRKVLALELIKIGALFSAGRDWSPAELVEYYREQGDIQEKFRTIAWTGPTEYSIVER